MRFIQKFRSVYQRNNQYVSVQQLQKGQQPQPQHLQGSRKANIKSATRSNSFSRRNSSANPASENNMVTKIDKRSISRADLQMSSMQSSRSSKDPVPLDWINDGASLFGSGQSLHDSASGNFVGMNDLGNGNDLPGCADLMTRFGELRSKNDNQNGLCEKGLVPQRRSRHVQQQQSQTSVQQNTSNSAQQAQLLNLQQSSIPFSQSGTQQSNDTASASLMNGGDLDKEQELPMCVNNPNGTNNGEQPIGDLDENSDEHVIPGLDEDNGKKPMNFHSEESESQGAATALSQPGTSKLNGQEVIDLTENVQSTPPLSGVPVPNTIADSVSAQDKQGDSDVVDGTKDNEIDKDEGNNGLHALLSNQEKAIVDDKGKDEEGASQQEMSRIAQVEPVVDLKSSVGVIPSNTTKDVPSSSTTEPSGKQQDHSEIESEKNSDEIDEDKGPLQYPFIEDKTEEVRRKLDEDKRARDELITLLDSFDF